MMYEEMENQIRERIISCMRENNVSETSLADGEGKVQKRINYQLKPNTSISIDTVLRFLARFPNVSAEWLLRGEGAMIKGEEDPKSKEAMDIAQTYRKEFALFKDEFFTTMFKAMAKGYEKASVEVDGTKNNNNQSNLA